MRKRRPARLPHPYRHPAHARTVAQGEAPLALPRAQAAMAGPAHIHASRTSTQRQERHHMYMYMYMYRHICICTYINISLYTRGRQGLPLPVIESSGSRHHIETVLSTSCACAFTVEQTFENVCQCTEHSLVTQRLGVKQSPVEIKHDGSECWAQHTSLARRYGAKTLLNFDLHCLGTAAHFVYRARGVWRGVAVLY
jgi:aldehyde:ferredoxin oxidoreductase